MAFTVGVAVVPPAVIPGPDHTKVAPGVVEEPPKFNDVVVHVNVISIPAFAFGIKVLPVTVVVVEAVQPFVGSVTVIV